MPVFWVRKVGEALNERGRSVQGAKVLVLGVAYKRDIDDLRESPALDIIRLLEQQGAHGARTTIPTCRASRRTGTDVRSVPLTPEAEVRGRTA